MTTPPPEDFDQDPTGVRDLLRSLPDPGPMPPAVADRITAALAREQAGRGDNDHDNVTPLTRTSATGRSRGANRTRSSRPMQLVTGLVAAAAVAAVAVVGYATLQGDKVPTSAVPSTMSSSQLASRVHVASTGTDYTPASFNAQAASMASSNASASPDPAQVARLGSLGTPSGVIACVRSVGGSLLDSPDDIKVDLATFEGKPAVVVVVRKGSTETAFAVSTTCSKGTAPFAAPRAV